MKKLFISCIIGIMSSILIFASIGPSVASAKESQNDPALQKHLQEMKELEALDLNDYELKVVVDNDLERIVETVENGKVTTGSLDKTTNVMTIETEGEETITIDLNNTYEHSSEPILDEITVESGFEHDLNISPFAVIAQENTWTNYEYTINTGNKWQLRRPQPGTLTKTYYKNVTEKSSNKSNLSKFKSSVDKLNTAEWKYLGLSFTVPIGTAATVVAAAINGGAAIAVGLATAGIVGAAASAALDMHRHAKDAHYYYFTV